MESPCPGEPGLRALLEGGPREDEPLVRHVEECTSCRGRLEALAGGSGWVPNESELSAAVPLPDAVHRAIHAAGTDDGPTAVEALSSATDVLQCLAPPTSEGTLGRLGPYEILAVIGSGGMGVVLKAQDPALSRKVAIKVLSPRLAALASARRRFAREGRAAATIRHPNVVTVHASGEANGLPYLVMDYIEGESLEDRLRREGPLEVAEVVKTGLELTQGLAAAHDRGVVHRDIKPANVLLESGSLRARISDFGIARCLEEPSSTVAGEYLGTPQYMAPEQCLGGPVDHRTDLFSLGGVLYAMCTGHPPFEGAAPIALLRRVCDTEPPPLRDLRPELPEWLVELIERLLRKAPADRFASASEVGSALEAGGSGRAPATRRDATVHSPARRLGIRLAIAAVLAAGILAALGLSGVFRGGSGESPAVSGGPLGEPAAAGAPFLLLDRSGSLVARCLTLPEAVEAAHSGATIEVHGDGPFRLQPIEIRGKALAIRAAPGARPVLTVPAGAPTPLTTNAPLVLEGLELREEPRVADSPEPEPPGTGEETRRPEAMPFVRSFATVLLASNCRLVSPYTNRPLLTLHRPRRCAIRNCELYGRSAAIYISPREHPQNAPEHPPLDLSVENSIFLSGLAVNLGGGTYTEGIIRLRRNTIHALWALQACSLVSTKPMELTIEANIIRADCLLKVFDRPRSVAQLRGFLNWQERDNIYACRIFGGYTLPSGVVETAASTLREWISLWRRGRVNAILGDVTFRGEEEIKKGLESLTAEAFQLEQIQSRPGGPVSSLVLSARGADVSIVGPGEPCRRFRATDGHAEWLAEVASVLQGPTK